MNILLINSLFPPVTVGGAEESVLELAGQLGQDGHAVTVACLGPEDGRIEELSLPGVSVARLRTPVTDGLTGATARSLRRRLAWHAQEGWRPRARAFLRSVVDSTRPDVVHTHSIAGFGTVAWNVHGERPLIHTLRDYYLLCVNSRTYTDEGGNCSSPCGRCSVLRAPQRLVASRPDLFVGISAAVVERHRSFGYLSGRDRTAVVPNQPQVPEGIAATARPAGSGTRFGFIGRLESYKGLGIVLQAFRDVPGEDHELVVAGEGDDSARSALTSAMATDSRIRYVGRVAKGSFYAAVDVVLVPSQWHEPYGRVAGEAGQAGRSVIVSGVGGLPEAVEASPEGRVVSDYWNVAAWARAMREEAAAGPRSGHRPPMSGGPSVATRYVELYERVLRSRDPAATHD